MADRPPLVRGQVGVGLAVAQGFETARGEAGGRDHGCAAQIVGIEAVEGPAVAPGRTALWRHDVARLVEGCGPSAGF